MSTPKPLLDQSSLEGWGPVSTGLLTGLSTGLRERRRREVAAVRIARITAFAVVFAIGSMFALHGVTASYEPRFGGVTCNDVICNSSRYLSGRLDAEMYDKVFHHLAECEECSHDIVRMRELAQLAHHAPERVTMEQRVVPVERSVGGIAKLSKWFRSVIHSWNGCDCHAGS